jgi:hypothetical protein
LLSHREHGEGTEQTQHISVKKTKQTKRKIMNAKLDKVQYKITPAAGPAGQPGIINVAFATENEVKPVVYPAEDRVEITDPPATTSSDEELEKRFPALGGRYTD